MRIILRVLCLTLLGASLLGAADAPALTDVQKLQVRNALQQVEIVQLRLLIAQREAEHTKADAQALLKTLVVPGWSLDLSTLAYTKTPPVTPDPALRTPSGP